MFQQKLCQFSQMVSLIFLCLAILLAIAHSKQSLNKNDGGITYFDNSQNIKIKDRTMIRNNVYLIKIDCGNICNTSYESELTLHKGKIKSFESNTGKNKKERFGVFYKICILYTNGIYTKKFFIVTTGKYVPEIIKEYECDELFQSPLFDQPSELLNPNGRW